MSRSIIYNVMIQVWKETQNHYKEYAERQSELYNTIPSRAEMMALTRFPNTEIQFLNNDCIDIALSYKFSGIPTALLNMADWDRAGGCVDSGANTQEEECFRRSNYFKHLRSTDFYPLGPLDTIVSRDVEFYRGGLQHGYAYIDRPICLDMIASPALMNPDFTKKDVVELFEKKIVMLLYAAAKIQCDVFVVSAWGCGAYGCDPTVVAKLFHKVLAENNGLFKRIVFAIKGRNFKLFKNAF